MPFVQLSSITKNKSSPQILFNLISLNLFNILLAFSMCYLNSLFSNTFYKRITTSDICYLLPLLLEPDLPLNVYETFLQVCKPSPPPFFEFAPNTQTEQCITLNLENYQWPPANGYTLLWWIILENYDDIFFFFFN